jgi:chromate transporter
MGEGIHHNIEMLMNINHPVSLWHLFRTWAGIGIQSFGGGATTLYLMRKVVVEEQHWLSDEDYALYWGIVQIAPGINILGHTVLVGWKVAGFAGAVVSLLGLLLPSISLTVLITAGYTLIRDQPMVAAALQGIIPATVGIGLILVVQMLRPTVQSSYREGRFPLILTIIVIIMAPALLLFSHIPTIIVLWGAGLVMGIGFWLFRRGETP